MTDQGAILITGARGRIGACLARHWRDGHDLVLLDREDGDLAVPDPAWTDRFAGVGTVVHLAGDPDPRAGFESAGAGNVLATLNVLRACAAHGVRRVVYASSVWADWAPWQLAERMTWYAASKIAGEALVAAWAHETPDRAAVCLRFGWFDPTAPTGTPVQEARRLDAGTLAMHADAALARDAPGCVVRYAVGRLAGPDVAADAARPAARAIA